MKENLLLRIFRKKTIEVKKKKTLVSSLAPKVLKKKEDIEKIQTYLDKLNETIDTKGISNIALTGGYGSGKSTVIKTFQSLNDQYEYLNISLASFNKKKEDENNSLEDNKIQKDELERLLEVSILQQIFYHVKPEQIPESRFKRIDNISNFRIFVISISFVLWVVSTTLILRYGYLDRINPNNWTLKNSFDWWALPIFLISLSGLGILSKLVINLFSNSKINKVNIKGELELGDNVNKSVFNEHLEEILYFFERTKYDVVIIEDLDRFDSTDIFTKLREINILLNNSLLIEREINFIYAVGDDLFGDRKERVKFFEYIIPVIPFVNSSNADEQLSLLITEYGFDKNILFTKEFISDITTFIDDIDMRLLTNIFQEFVIYLKTLKPQLTDKKDELFAMITYKNIDPKDFNELSRKEGKLYSLINNKKNYIKKLLNKIDSEISRKDSEIKDIEKYKINDISELNSIYFQKILSKLPETALITILKKESDFYNVIENQILDYKYHVQGYGNVQESKLIFKFSEIENEVDSTYNYEQRVEQIRSKKSNKTTLLKKEIDKLKSKKSEVNNWDLKQIFTEVDINKFLHNFSNSKLLRNLILEGYINENYNDYISLFYEGSLTLEDKKFEQNVKGQYNSKYNYKLTNVDNLIDKKFELKHYSRESILNFDLLDYLGENYVKYSEKYDSIIKLLSNEKIKSIEFIDEYVMDPNRTVPIFIAKLTENWKGFWDYIYYNSHYSTIKVNKYLELIISSSETEDILNNQSHISLVEAIEKNPEFLSLLKDEEKTENYRKIAGLLIGSGVKFDGLEDPNLETQSLFDYVYSNNHYKRNIHNIRQMLVQFGIETVDKDFDRMNYTTILQSNCQPLIDYVNTDIHIYLENVYLKLEENKFDYEENLLKLLNNTNLDNKIKVKIIQKVETKISNLNKIKELEIKTQLLLHDKVYPIWNNVTDYFTECENQIDESLIRYLNFENVYSGLSKENMLHKSDNFDYPAFREKLLLTNELTNESYTKLLESSIYTRPKLNFEKLDGNKIKYLIQNILQTTRENYVLLKEHFPNNHIILLEKDFRMFLDKNTDFETDETEILLLLKSDKIKIDEKFDYIKILNASTIAINKEISKMVGEIILLKIETIDYDITTLKSIVINLSTSEKRIKFINLFLEKITDADITILLSSIYKYDDLFKNKKPTYPKTNYNGILLEKLKSKGLIKNVYDDKWNDDNYRVTTNY